MSNLHFTYFTLNRFGVIGQFKLAKLDYASLDRRLRAPRLSGGNYVDCQGLKIISVWNAPKGDLK